MAPQPSEADIIFNRANVALAKSQRLVASWLPPRTEEEIKNAKTEEEIEREEQELFTPVPELYVCGSECFFFLTIYSFGKANKVID